jgi:hypothetical protein
MFPYRDQSPQLNTYGVVPPTHFVSVPLLSGGNAGLNFRDAALASPPTPGGGGPLQNSVYPHLTK